MATGSTGIKIFNWLATMWAEKLISSTYVVLHAFFPIPACRSTGIMPSAAPFDWQRQVLLLRGCTLPLCHRRWNPLFALWRFLLLVPEDVRKDAQRIPGKAPFLVVRYRVPSHVRLYAHSRNIGHAAKNLYVRTGPRLGHVEPDHNDWSCFSSGRYPGLRQQSRVVLPKGRGCRERSLGRMDSGMVGQLTATGI